MEMLFLMLGHQAKVIYMLHGMTDPDSEAIKITDTLDEPPKH